MTHIIFGSFTCEVVLFTHRTYTYIGKIDNARHSSVAVISEETRQKVQYKEKEIDDDTNGDQNIYT
jgi:hypothetical protein